MVFNLFLKDKWKLIILDRSKSIYLNCLNKLRTPLNHRIYRGVLTSSYIRKQFCSFYTLNASDMFVCSICISISIPFNVPNTWESYKLINSQNNTPSNLWPFFMTGKVRPKKGRFARRRFGVLRIIKIINA